MEGEITTSIDIVMPSIRADVKDMLEFMSIDVPDGVSVSYYIVSDRPGLKSQRLEYNGCPVHIIVNKERLGAPQSRNVGIDAGSGQYILFLDDDVRPPRDLLCSYMEMMRTEPDAAGYVGPTLFPNPINSFTRGIIASSMTTMFELPTKRDWMSWGTTSNLMIPRSKLGCTRFSDLFPAHGGGEDIDFCLKMLGSGKWFRTVPKAAVRHGWWGNGRRSYRRFFRWAFGDSRLPFIHTRFRYYDAPNGAESLLFALPAVVAAAATGLVPYFVPLAWVGCAIISEITAEQIRVRKTSGRLCFAAALESTFIRASNDAGRVCGILSRRHIRHLFSRFDYIGTGEWMPAEKKMLRTRFAAISGSLLALLMLGTVIG